MIGDHDIAHCEFAELHQRLNLSEPFDPPTELRETPLHAWNMEQHDATILAYLYRQLRPRRHLEFGTWRGFGARLCLQSCDATAWSLNAPQGESLDNGHWLYYTSVKPGTPIPPGAATRTTPKGNIAVQTDGGAMIGRLVHEAGLGHRFCQILCDSREWDTSNYPGDFFDTVLVDGGHTAPVVENDTHKALSVVRSGGAILWHDFCLDAAVDYPSVRGVHEGIERVLPVLREACSDLFWIKPSWLLMGVKR